MPKQAELSITNARNRAERREHAAAYDAMRASRPLTPPPTVFELRRVTAASLALRADIRYGLIDV